MPARSDLGAILADERSCLVEGRLADLPMIVARKQAILAEGGRPHAGEGRDHLGALLAQARANERLLAAALGGVRAALGRVRAIQDATTCLTCYTSDGRAVRHAIPTPAVESKA